MLVYGVSWEPTASKYCNFRLCHTLSTLSDLVRQLGLHRQAGGNFYFSYKNNQESNSEWRKPCVFHRRGLHPTHTTYRVAYVVRTEQPTQRHACTNTSLYLTQTTLSVLPFQTNFLLIFYTCRRFLREKVVAKQFGTFSVNSQNIYIIFKVVTSEKRFDSFSGCLKLLQVS